MHQLFDITNHVAVVTGSTKGMGLAIARALGRRKQSRNVSGTCHRHVKSERSRPRTPVSGWIADFGPENQVTRPSRHRTGPITAPIISKMFDERQRATGIGAILRFNRAGTVLIASKEGNS